MSSGADIVMPEGGSALGEEDQARANLYGLLARLWYAGPDQALLDAVSQSGDSTEGAAEGTGETALAAAWRGLARASAGARPDELAIEYDALFVGTGRSEITLYCSHYLTDTGRERVLVALRDELPKLGLSRSSETNEPEDHFAGLLEVMRHLIVQGSDGPEISFQKNFFLRYIRSAYVPLTDAVLENGGAHFYKDVARLTRAYLDVESQSFDMV